MTADGAGLSSGACISHGFESASERFFGKLGFWIGSKPGQAGFLGFLLLFGGLPGMWMLEGDREIMFLTIDTSFLDQFAVKGTRYMLDYQAGITEFQPVRANQLVYAPTGGGSALDLAFLKDVLEIENHILQNLTVGPRKNLNGATYDFEDVCSRAFDGGPCDVGSVFNVIDHSAASLSTLQTLGHTNLSAAILQAEVASGHSFKGLLLVNMGGMSRTMAEAPYSEWSPTAVSSILPLSGDGAKKDACMGWEESLVAYAIAPTRPGAQTVTISVFTESTLDMELKNAVISALWLILATLVVMVGYAISFLGTQTRIPGNTQMNLVSLAAIIPGLAGFGAFGWLAYLGLKMNVIVTLAPFLVLAVGLDDTFVLAFTWHCPDAPLALTMNADFAPGDARIVSAVRSVGEMTKSKDDLPEVMSRAMALGGSAITVTSLTSILAFTVAAITSRELLGFMTFSICLTIALVLNYLGMLVLFPAMIVFNERRILDGKSDLAPMLKGPLKIEQAMLKFDASTALRNVITKKYAPTLARSRPLQLVGASIMAGLVAASGYAFTVVGRGMPDLYFVGDHSFVHDFYGDVERHFDNKLRIEVGLMFTGLDLTSPSEVAAVRTDVIEPLRNRTDVIEVVCVVEQYEVAKAQAALGGVTLSVADFLALSNTTTRTFERAVTPNAIYCGVYVEQPVTAQERRDQTVALTEMADTITAAQGGAFSLTIYHISFPIHVARFDLIFNETLTTAGWAILAVFCALLLALPVHLAIISALNVACVVVVVVGFMTVAGITFNAISYTTIVMAIGFCVDYTVHIMHFSNLGKASDPMNVKMQRGIELCGYDVLHGASTAFFGVFMLSFGQSHAFRFFGYMSMVIAGIGGTFALFCLPSVMLLLSSSGRMQTQDSSAVAPGTISA